MIYLGERIFIMNASEKRRSDFDNLEYLLKNKVEFGYRVRRSVEVDVNGIIK